ncbi:MAG: hypothetical protein M3179_14560, partial [Actinomycetota bacterium]|nr:hypothetical protein [Actinomycetota bacterium]
GKVALSPVGETNGDAAPAPSSPAGSDATDSPGGGGSADAGSSPEREYVSFEDSFAAEAESAFGDLGPAEPARTGGGPRGGGDGGPRRNRSRPRRPGNRR